MANDGDRMTIKEMLVQRWKGHRDAFRIGGFNDGATKGVVVVDRYVQPPQAVVVAVQKDGRPIAVYFDLADDAAARGPLSDIAAQGLLAQGLLEPTARKSTIAEAMNLIDQGDGTSPLAALSVRRFAESFHDPRVASRLPLADCQSKEEARLAEAGLADLRGGLDPEALHALEALESFGWRDYMFYAEPGEKGANRRQQAEIYPLLAGLFVQRAMTIQKAIDNKTPLVDAIQAAFGNDAEDKPILGKATISRLRGVRWKTGGIPPDAMARALAAIPPDWFPKDRAEWDAFCDLHVTIGTVLHEATGLGPDVLYKGCGGKWVDFKERLAKAYTDTRPPEGTRDEDLAAFQAAIDWKHFEGLPRARVAAEALDVASRLELPAHLDAAGVADWIVRLYAPDTSREALRNACLDVEDMLDSFAYKVVVPLAANESGLDEVYLSTIHYDEARRGAATALCAGKAANAIFENCRHFHSQHEAVMAAGADEETAEERQGRLEREARAAAAAALAPGIADREIPENGWAPLSAAIQAPNGVWVVPLTDPALLTQEGHRGVNADGSEGLHHCVAGYHNACRTRGHQIVSFRKAPPPNSGAPFLRLSTVEIGPITQGDTTLTVCQHRGKHNGKPPEEAERAFQWYRERIADGTIRLNYEGIREYLAASSTRGDDAKQVCGYEWRERRRVATAMYPWGRYVGKRYRDMDIDAFAKQPEVANVVTLINPSSAPSRRR